MDQLLHSKQNLLTHINRLNDQLSECIPKSKYEGLETQLQHWISKCKVLLDRESYWIMTCERYDQKLHDLALMEREKGQLEAKVQGMEQEVSLAASYYNS
jgi:hypothetical protein